MTSTAKRRQHRTTRTHSRWREHIRRTIHAAVRKLQHSRSATRHSFIQASSEILLIAYRFSRVSSSNRTFSAQRRQRPVQLSSFSRFCALSALSSALLLSALSDVTSSALRLLVAVRLEACVDSPLNVTITHVMLSHPVPSPVVSGARQNSNI